MAKQIKKQAADKPVKEPTDEQLQGNQHDKIIKESIEETMHFMLKTFGNIDVVRSEQLPTEIQQTQERKPDFLKIIVDTEGVERIGHIEFHVKDEADISYRAFETCAMMKRKKPHLGIYQIIVYMGMKPAEKIITEWSDEQYTYKIKLIQFITTPVEVFLKAESAAEVVLGILSDFGDQTPEIILPQLVDKVVEYAKTDLEQLKFLKHLQIFGKLRNFEPLINKIMDNTIAYFGLKDEDDYMYQKGFGRGKADYQADYQADLQQKDADLLKKNADLQQKDADLLKKNADLQQKDADLLKKNADLQLAQAELTRMLAEQAKALEAQKRLEYKERMMVIQLLDAGVLTEFQVMKDYDMTYSFVQSVKKDLVEAPKKIARLKKNLSAEKIAHKLSLPTNWVEKQLNQMAIS